MRSVAARFECAVSTISPQPQNGGPNGIQTRVNWVKTSYPKSLDDEAVKWSRQGESNPCFSLESGSL